jgi:hypothetical protein
MLNVYKNMKKKIAKSWSLGIYTGDSPFNLNEYSGNPILTARQINDVPAHFIADPFIIANRDKYYLFFEVLNAKSDLGEIGLASSDNLYNWKYERIVLKEDYHLSYPMVFHWDGDIYMLPETSNDKSIRLYIADNFPFKWKFVGNMLKGESYRDSTIFRYNGIWWLFTTSDDYAKRHFTRLRLFYSKDLISNTWTEHPKSPVKIGRYARPGGRILFINDKIFRFSQDLLPCYGSRIIVSEITTLTKSTYNEETMEDNPFLVPGKNNWNKTRIHNIDYYRKDENKWIIVTDGYSEECDLRMNIWGYRILNKIWKICIG